MPRNGKKAGGQRLLMKMLEDRIRADGIVREGNVLKVDSFINHQMDIPLFREMAREGKGGNIDENIKEKVAKKLSEIFGLDYEKILKKVSKRSSIETIAKKVDKEKTDELRKWMEEENITTGINIDEDTKRYYPNNNLASQIIGFCGSDNQGLDGIEAKYDTVLSGTKGAIKRHTDAKGAEIGEEGEKYVAAKNGKDVILAIDMNVQSIVEKYLKEACIDNKCTDGGNIVAMNPKNIHFQWQHIVERRISNVLLHTV